MPADYPQLPARSIQLANGLRTLLLQDPHSHQLGIAAGVAVGSLDEPAAWPGMAHFLEHALFLGSAAAPGNGEFARLIQQAGGRYNARTLNTCTLYHLEVPASAGEQALGLLLDILTRPLLAAERLQAERGVLDAEYRARCADPWSQACAAVSHCLNPDHPISAFHHGHAASLPADDADFRAALHAFHRRHYAVDQLSLLLCGPQSLDEQEALLHRLAGTLQGQGQPARRDWPNVWTEPQAIQLSLDQSELQRLSLWLPLPAHPQQASLLQQLDLLLQASHPGSLLHHWRSQGLVRQLACSLHDAGNQQLLEVGLMLEAAACGREAGLAAALRDQLQAIACDPQLQQTLALSQQAASALAWEEMTLLPMERALQWLQRWMAQPDCQPWQAWPAASALQQWLTSQPADCWLLQDCRPGSNRQHTAWFPVGFERQPLHWPAPQPSAFSLSSQALQDAAPAAAIIHPPCWQQDQVAGLREGHGLLALNWQLPPALAELGLPGRLALDRAWQQEQGEARLHGCSYRSQHDGDQLQLSLQGPVTLLPRLAERLCGQLLEQTPDDWLADWHSERGWRRSGLLIRRLLLEAESRSLGVEQRLQAGRGELQQAMHRLLASSELSLLQLNGGRCPQLPGQPHAVRLLPQPAAQWHSASEGGEQAVLLCLNAPASSADWQLAWQALRIQQEAAFFQRLRIEQGLGYIVFCRYRLAASGPQLQFGVQSPNTPIAALRQAILDFLASPATSTNWQQPLADSLQASPPWLQRQQQWRTGCSLADLQAASAQMAADEPARRLQSSLMSLHCG